jgi:hypothetical protein
VAALLAGLRKLVSHFECRPFTYTISRLDVRLYCEVAQHYPQYQAYFTKIHDATLKAGTFLGAVAATYAKPGAPGVGRADFADWRLFYNGPSFDGYQPPRPGARR